MATSIPQLAVEIRDAMGFPAPTSKQLIGFAHGILEELTQNGQATKHFMASGHKISGMTAPSLAGKIAQYAGYGYVSPQLLAFSNGVVTHIQTAGIVTYSAPPTAPPAIPPGADWFLDGKISGLSGPAMAALIVVNVGFPFTSSQLIKMCTAICSHIVDNAEVVSGVIS